MKRKKFLALLPVAMLTVKQLAAQTPVTNKKKMLIVYYSWSGNTRHLAEVIKNFTKADLLEIVPEKPYPSEYRKTVDQAKKELAENFKPPLKTKIPSLANYDIILVGSPNWWGTFASPIRTLLADNDFSKKKIAPFMTHEGSRMGRTVDDIKKLTPNSEMLPSLAIRGGDVKRADKNVETWLRANGML